MAEGRVIIVGAGFGGLLCGRILLRNGFSVTVLEQGTQPGGALQTFVREGIRFDTGFHSVGGLGPGEPLEQLFRPLGLMDLPWYRTEPDEFVDCDEAFLRLSAGTEDERSHVLAPYRQSTWRLQGGGKTLADALARDLDVRLRQRVTDIEDRTLTCADGNRLSADIVVADIHPKLLTGLLRIPVRKAWRSRIESREDGPGIFTVNAKLRPGALPYIDHSIFLDGKVMVHFGEKASDGSARSLDLLAFETPGQAAGDGTGPDRASYARSLIQTAAQRLPGLPEAIEKYWTSTPRTWERFTGTPGGSAYGICKRGPEDYLAPRTPLPWLFLTGQNLGLHGILGTAVSALNTCNAILHTL
ncbi:MAG: NAD(P)/FAD-dependent oxidoreductase [Bacteroidales bacterium]|nr:NAD(P)/FAD-dependent oxidoreductase [Bacteroidales bacterium]